MDQVHKNTRSTRTKLHKDSGEEAVKVIPIEYQETTNYIFVAMVDTVTGITVTNHTGAHQVVSSQVNCYVFILCDYKSNNIL